MIGPGGGEDEPIAASPGPPQTGRQLLHKQSIRINLGPTSRDEQLPSDSDQVQIPSLVPLKGLKLLIGAFTDGYLR